MSTRAKRKLPLKQKPKKTQKTPVEQLDSRSASWAKIDRAAEDRFLQKIFEGCTTGVACEAIGVSRQAIYAHRDKHKEFSIAWAQAQEQGRDERADKVRNVMWERAVDGYQETEVRQWKSQNGKTRTATKMIKKVDNVLLLNLAKSLMPGEFRDQLKVDKTVDVGEALAELMERAHEAPTNHIGNMVK